jgi:quercetin dioxygenase-like cupin family protein
MNQQIIKSNTDIEAKKLIDEIEYQSEGIVSKQIIKKNSGNITLFAMDVRQSLTEHTSPYEAVVQIIEGVMEIKIGGKSYEVNEGEIICMPPNIPHGLAAKEKTKMLLIMIKN